MSCSIVGRDLLGEVDAYSRWGAGKVVYSACGGKDEMALSVLGFAEIHPANDERSDTAVLVVRHRSCP